MLREVSGHFPAFSDIRNIRYTPMSQPDSSGMPHSATPLRLLCCFPVDGEREPRRVFSPHDVAERMGISGQRLRQLARSYERVRGDLPRDERGRVWPEEAVEELERTRELVKVGRASGIEQALRGELVSVGEESQPATRNPSGSDIAAEFAGELRAMREAIEEQNRILEAMTTRMEDLERENRELREAVSQPPTDRELGAPDRAARDAPGEPSPASREDAGDTPPSGDHARRWTNRSRARGGSLGVSWTSEAPHPSTSTGDPTEAS
jgi:hypothetical protein